MTRKSVKFLTPLLFSRWVVSDAWQPHGLQNTTLLCPPLSPGLHLDSCPFSQWCHPTSSSSVIPFSSCLQSFPARGSFPKSQLFTSDGQSIGTSALASILPMNIQDWFPLGWLDLLAIQGTLKSLLQHHSSKASILQCSAFFMVQLSHLYMTAGKCICTWLLSFDSKNLCWQSDVYAFEYAKFVVAFLPRRTHLLISWLHWDIIHIPNNLHIWNRLFSGFCISWNCVVTVQFYIFYHPQKKHITL